MSADNWADCPRCDADGTWREDWDIYGAETGTITFEYSGACSSRHGGCGREVDRTYSFDVPQ